MKYILKRIQGGVRIWHRFPAAAPWHPLCGAALPPFGAWEPWPDGLEPPQRPGQAAALCADCYALSVQEEVTSAK